MLKQAGAEPDLFFQRQPIVFVLVSIMSSNYQAFESVKGMMLALHNAYGNSNIPIVSVCGDTVYNITKPFLFKKTTERDPVEKGRIAWEKRREEAIAALKVEGVSLHHETVYWNTVKQVQYYPDIRKFTGVVFDRELTLEKLQIIFPSAGIDILQELIQDIQITNFLEKIPAIAMEFKSKNLVRLEKISKAKEKEDSALLAKLARLIETPEKIQTHGGQLELKELQRGLLQATYQFLSEEFAVFLLLSFLQHEKDIKHSLHLESLTLDSNAELQPILSYPISTTKGSDTIFDTFRMVEALYLKYCTFLDLPIIARPAMIIDPFLLGTPYPSYEIPVSHEIRKSEAISKERLSPTLLFFTPQACSEDDSSNIAEKIMHKIDKHLSLKSTATTRTLYKNGITCEITSWSALKAGDSVTDLQDIKMLIESALYNVRNNAAEEDMAIFNYKGHHFELAVKPTGFRSALVRTPSPT